MTHGPRVTMVAAAARQIRDGEVVFAGMRLPLLGFAVAKATHAPGAIGLFENGLIRELPPRGFVITMGDGPNQSDATCATTLLDVMGMLQRRRVDVGFLGGAEVDAFGNLNTTKVAATRLPGSGGGSDIAALARRCVYIMEHERRRFVERVAYVTSRPRGVVTLITTLGIFTLSDGPPRVASLHGGVTREQVETETGFALDFTQCVETPEPSEAELRAIGEADPSGFWTR
ncbi:MAG: CoA-transferase [Candidatus Eremiobacteraeota bacterium]|nr:CoA-transferase [Candidatus Eremiobacteraeota bacterium]